MLQGRVFDLPSTLKSFGEDVLEELQTVQDTNQQVIEMGSVVYF